MTTPRFEAFLARLYTDAGMRGDFLADPRGTALRQGLDAPEIDALLKIDSAGLELAAGSYERKRSSAHPRPMRFGQRLRLLFGLRRLP